MSCCPPPQSIQSTTFVPDEPKVGAETSRLPGESEECFNRRTGNVSETGRVDDKTQPIDDRIQQHSVVTDGSGSGVTINMTFTTNGPTPVTSWAFTPSSFAGPMGGVSTAGATISGTFDPSLYGQKLSLRVVANGSTGPIDDRTYSFSPSLEQDDDVIRLLHPLPGSIITSGFGPRKPPAQGASSSHLALDFAYPGRVTKDVFCCADGEVILARPGSGYGNYVVVRHTNGSGKHLINTLYAHLDSIYVRVGQRVAAGQALGKEGNTGVGTGPHLHFEVRLPNNTRVDPSPYLRGEVRVAGMVTPDNQPSTAAPVMMMPPTNGAITPANVSANSNCETFGPTYADPPTVPPPTPPAPEPPTAPTADPFDIAYYFVLTEEVGPHWMSTPETTPVALGGTNQDIDDGLIDNSQQRRNTGFVNHSSDPGGITKFGIAQRYNPRINVSTCTFADARSTAYDGYWLASQRPCNTLSLPIAAMVFDCNYLFGPGGSAQIFSNSTITGTETGQDAINALNSLYVARVAYLNRRSPALLKDFGKGWIRRAQRALAYAKNLV